MAEPFQIGFTLCDRYRIDSFLGKGGMAIVYKATDLVLSRTVAIKIIHEHLLENLEALLRFEMEARSFAKLCHNNILQIFDFGNYNGRCFMVTQFLSGETLDQHLNKLKIKGGKLSLSEIVLIALDICKGLEHAHNHNLIHRDIKPANIMLRNGEEVVIMDFGIAKSYQEVFSTSPGLVVGTPVYLSPEQALAKPLDGRSDLYSLGIVLFEMVVGYVPFISDTSNAVLLMHVNDPPPKISEIVKDANPTIIAIIEKALAKDPSNRFQTANEMATALQAIKLDLDRKKIDTTYKTDEIDLKNFPFAKLIKHDFSEKKGELRSILNEFVDYFLTQQIEQIIGRDFTKFLLTQRRELFQRLESKFSLVVIGDFKRGKSTLINALLGLNVVTTDVTPETVTINKITYGPTLKAEIHLPDGKHVPLNVSDLKLEKLSKILETLSQKPSYIQIEVPVEWLSEIQLVDTPGMGDVLQTFDKDVLNYLNQADAVLYLISAISPLSESERSFLQFSLRPYDFPKVCFIINRLDSLPTKRDRKKVVDLIKSKLQNIYPNTPIFAISALDEFCRLDNQPQPQVREFEDFQENFKSLRYYLNSVVFLNHNLIKLERTINYITQFLDNCLSTLIKLQHSSEISVVNIGVLIGKYENHNSELFKKINAHKKNVKDQIDTLCEETISRINQFLERLRKEVISNLKQFNYEDIQRHFPFFLTDVLRDAISKCIDAHQASIIDSIKLESSVLAEIENLSLDPSCISPIVAEASLNSKGWNWIDNFHLIIEFTGFNKVLGDILLGFTDKKLAVGERIDRYQAQLLSFLPDIQKSLEREIRKLYFDIANKTQQQLEVLYKQKVDSTLLTLRQAKELQQMDSQHSTTIKEAVKELIKRTEKTQDILKKFQERFQRAEQIVQAIGYEN